MGKSQTKIRRISADLSKEIEGVASKNNISYADASRELCKELQKIKGTTKTREIRF